MSWLGNLAAGTYWIEIASAGDPGFQGPFAVPTVPRNVTDNSRFLDVASGTWANNVDNGVPVDFPFELEGKIISGGGCDIDSYTLSVSGTCPGVVTFNWENAAPNSQQGLVYGARLGNTVIPPGSACEGTSLGISGNVRLVVPPGVFGTGSSGMGSLSGNASSGACGGYLQLVEGGSCRTSNIAQLP